MVNLDYQPDWLGRHIGYQSTFLNISEWLKGTWLVTLALTLSSLAPFPCALLPDYREISSFTASYASTMMFLPGSQLPWTEFSETTSQIKTLLLSVVSVLCFVPATRKLTHTWTINLTLVINCTNLRNLNRTLSRSFSISSYALLIKWTCIAILFKMVSNNLSSCSQSDFVVSEVVNFIPVINLSRW